ncbi:MAG TPA: succinate dehydrogenase assembly factor 2 [Caulobacteraceae bacterium]|nr:succinate dehydrogenase assembly factor 2 [Caulobacteraceae bacterium]
MDETRLKRLRFRAWRRGFREADLILGPFADTHASDFTEAEISAFEALLDQPDHDVYGWIVGTDPAPDPFETELLARIRAFQARGGARIPNSR